VTEISASSSLGCDMFLTLLAAGRCVVVLSASGLQRKGGGVGLRCNLKEIKVPLQILARAPANGEEEETSGDRRHLTVS